MIEGERFIVTSLGILERRDGEFVLVRYFPADCDAAATIDGIRARTGWDLHVADDCAPEPDPAPEALALLRTYDPQRLFLGPL